jgi:hypothetical protein
MIIGKRQRHRNLTIVLFAKLTAILPCYPDQVPPLLRQARVIDDPCRQRPVTLHPRQHHLAYLGQHPRVRPSRLPNKMQQRLMLRSRSFRRRHRRHRLELLRSPGIISPMQ